MVTCQGKQDYQHLLDVKIVLQVLLTVFLVVAGRNFTDLQASSKPR